MDEYIAVTTIPEHIKRIKLDVGLSYTANQCQAWLEHDKDLFVFGFEPNPDCIASVRKGNIIPRPEHPCIPLSDENAKRMHLIPVALGNVFEKTELDFYMMDKDCGTSSLHKPAASSLGPVKNVIKVPVYSLAMFFDVFPWDRFEHIEYLKVDAQGADLDIVVGAGNYLQERVVYATIEPESNAYESCGYNTESNITAYMEANGFERVYHPNASDPTYLNKKFKHLAESIYIFQRG